MVDFWSPPPSMEASFEKDFLKIILSGMVISFFEACVLNKQIAIQIIKQNNMSIINIWKVSTCITFYEAWIFTSNCNNLSAPVSGEWRIWAAPPLFSHFQSKNLRALSWNFYLPPATFKALLRFRFLVFMCWHILRCLPTIHQTREHFEVKDRMNALSTWFMSYHRLEPC